MKNDVLAPKSPPSSTNYKKTWQGLNLTVHPALPGVVKKIVDWFNAGAGGLVLAGDTGCGKTHIARVVYDAAGGPVKRLPDKIDYTARHVDPRIEAIFYSEPKLLEQIRQSYGNGGRGDSEVINQCQDAKILIVDDVGAAYVKQESAEWYADVWWRLLDSRAGRNLPILITTNLAPSELKTRIGKRAFSRLQALLGGPDNYVLMFDIPDYRARGW